MKNIRLAVATAGLAAAALPGVASADDTAFYVGGAFGLTIYSETCDRVLIPCDAEDTGWRVFGGYQFHRNVAVELGYANLGEATGATDNFGGAPGSFKRETKGVDLTVVGMVPLTARLSGLVRVGAYRLRTYQDQEGFFGTIHDGKTQSGWTYGAGLQYQMGALGIRTEFQRYNNVGEDTISTVKDDIHMYSVGLLLRF